MKKAKPSKKKPVILDEPQTIQEKIGRRIKEIRLKKGHTSYEDFAYENEISRSQYGRMERGHDMRISSLAKVLNALGVTWEEFFKGFDK